MMLICFLSAAANKLMLNLPISSGNWISSLLPAYVYLHSYLLSCDLYYFPSNGTVPWYVDWPRKIFAVSPKCYVCWLTINFKTHRYMSMLYTNIRIWMSYINYVALHMKWNWMSHCVECCCVPCAFSKSLYARLSHLS